MGRPKLDRLENGAVVHKEKVDVIKYIKCPCGKKLWAEDFEFGGGPAQQTEVQTCECGKQYLFRASVIFINDVESID